MKVNMLKFVILNWLQLWFFLEQCMYVDKELKALLFNISVSLSIKNRKHKYKRHSAPIKNVYIRMESHKLIIGSQDPRGILG